MREFTGDAEKEKDFRGPSWTWTWAICLVHVSECEYKPTRAPLFVFVFSRLPTHYSLSTLHA